jgi:hypothetical protein
VGRILLKTHSEVVDQEDSKRATTALNLNGFFGKNLMWAWDLESTGGGGIGRKLDGLERGI